MKLSEPIRGKHLGDFISDFGDKNYILSKYIPITSDIFVFFYPFYLVFLYLYGVYNKRVDYKYLSLYIFFAALGSEITNIMFQFIAQKDRPQEHLSSKKELILQNLPNESFPSDHMAISMVVASCTLLWGVHYRNKKLMYFSILLFLFAFTMGISRIASGLHRPTDIIGGLFLGIFWAFFLFYPKIFGFCKKYIYNPLIVFQQFLFKNLFGIKE